MYQAEEVPLAEKTEVQQMKFLPSLFFVEGEGKRGARNDHQWFTYFETE